MRRERGEKLHLFFKAALYIDVGLKMANSRGGSTSLVPLFTF